MEKHLKYICISAIIILLNSGCTSTATTKNVVESSGLKDTLLIYEDGRMQFNSRFLNTEDVIIYSDGKGGERAAIKVRVPIHPDFYRDSIFVVRVVHKYDEAISQHEIEKISNIN